MNTKVNKRDEIFIRSMTNYANRTRDVFHPLKTSPPNTKTIIIGNKHFENNRMESDSKLNIKKSLPKRSHVNWNTRLLTAIKDPSLIVFEDELTVVIKDRYPKARFHYLVCPKEDIPTLKRVNFQHLKLLKHMHEVGVKMSSKHKGSNFLIGYHSEPSMLRLHLHVISDDFDSQFLKTKKHWNSFTTEFFLPSINVIKELETTGEIKNKTKSEISDLIQRPLKCHKCEFIPKNLPDLKVHLKTHLS